MQYIISMKFKSTFGATAVPSSAAMVLNRYPYFVAPIPFGNTSYPFGSARCSNRGVPILGMSFQSVNGKIQSGAGILGTSLALILSPSRTSTATPSTSHIAAQSFLVLPVSTIHNYPACTGAVFVDQKLLASAFPRNCFSF